jgi:ABC-type lipoprotein export system ATPase subunit
MVTTIGVSLPSIREQAGESTGSASPRKTTVDPIVARRRSSSVPRRIRAFAESTKHRDGMRQRLDALAGDAPVLRVDGLIAGLRIERDTSRHRPATRDRDSYCALIGPNGAGKSTILHAIFGLADIRGGRVEVGGRNVTRLGPNAKLRDAGIAYVLQDSSVFPDMTVERNLWLGGYLMRDRADARQAAERVFERYPTLARRRNDPARVLSGGERRLLELSRALVMRPRLLLVDEPSSASSPPSSTAFSRCCAICATARGCRS